MLVGKLWFAIGWFDINKRSQWHTTYWKQPVEVFNSSVNALLFDTWNGNFGLGVFSVMRFKFVLNLKVN